MTAGEKCFERECLEKKYLKLKECLSELGSVAVAFSGGVDSALLLKAAIDAVGTDRVIALTAASRSFPAREFKEAEAFCREYGVKQVVCQSEELNIEGFRSNPENRCYLCKHALFEKFLAAADENHMDAVVEGSNLDDEGDYRPGMKAVKELGIRSPLRMAGLTKAEIRELSKQLGLPTWDKQSFACLLSRFVYGETISDEKLEMVDKAEQMLLDMGFRQVRVRIHGQEKGCIARIEILPEEFSRLLQREDCEKIYQRLKELGFSYVTLDLGGYRTGSMNETILSENQN